MKNKSLTNRIILLCGLTLVVGAQGAFAQKNLVKAAKALKPTSKTASRAAVCPSAVSASARAAETLSAIERSVTTRVATEAATKKVTVSTGQAASQVRRTAEEVLSDMRAFIEEKGRFPSRSSKNLKEKSLRSAFDKACSKAAAKNLQDKTSQKLLALKARWARQVDNASRAAKLAEKQLSTSGVETEEYIKQLMRFYDKLDPLGSGFIE